MSALTRHLARLERRRAALLERLGAMSPGQLVTRPAAGGWHVLDVVQHVVIVEERVLKAVATRPGPLPLTERLRSGLRLTALRIYLRSGGRIKAPNPALIPPAAPPSRSSFPAGTAFAPATPPLLPPSARPTSCAP